MKRTSRAALATMAKLAEQSAKNCADAVRRLTKEKAEVAQRLQRAESELREMQAYLGGHIRITERQDFQSGNLIVTGEKLVKIRREIRVSQISMHYDRFPGTGRRMAIEDITESLNSFKVE